MRHAAIAEKYNCFLPEIFRSYGILSLSRMNRVREKEMQK